MEQFYEGTRINSAWKTHANMAVGWVDHIRFIVTIPIRMSHINFAFVHIVGRLDTNLMEEAKGFAVVHVASAVCLIHITLIILDMVTKDIHSVTHAS